MGYCDRDECVDEFEELAAAGDRLAHELMYKHHPEILEKWWRLRGGHDKCTVCNPQMAHPQENMSTESL